MGDMCDRFRFRRVYHFCFVSIGLFRLETLYTRRTVAYSGPSLISNRSISMPTWWKSNLPRPSLKCLAIYRCFRTVIRSTFAITGHVARQRLYHSPTFYADCYMTYKLGFFCLGKQGKAHQINVGHVLHHGEEYFLRVPNEPLRSVHLDSGVQATLFSVALAKC